MRNPYKYYGIDISHWNGSIDFDLVKKSGVSFVIIKAGGSDNKLYKDSKFETYYKNAKNAGLAVGAYYFVGPNFLGSKNGLADSERFRNILGSKTFDFPVYLDLESTDPKNKNLATEASIAFLNNLEDHGWFAGIYASAVSGFQMRLDDSKLDKYTHWVADYSGRVDYNGSYAVHQYTSHGAITGVRGDVDFDKSNTMFNIIKNKHFNNF